MGRSIWNQTGGTIFEKIHENYCSVLFSLIKCKTPTPNQQLTCPCFNNNGVTAGKSLDVLWYTAGMLRENSEFRNWKLLIWNGITPKKSTCSVGTRERNALQWAVQSGAQTVSGLCSVWGPSCYHFILKGSDWLLQRQSQQRYVNTMKSTSFLTGY